MKTLVLVSVLALAGCSTSPKRDGSADTGASTATASAAVVVTTSAPVETATASAIPSAVAVPTAAASAAQAAAPLPDVDVTNIGMHVGGGKNDAAEKAPIKTAVAPQMDAFRACFAKVDDPKKGGDFGVDLKIPRDGGAAEVSHPRTSLKGEGFKECVLDAFHAVTFGKPKGGAMTVSYSLRFAPKK